MLKVELYKILHSKNIFYLFIVVFFVAFFLGANSAKMNISTGKELMSVIFVSSSAVLMLYISVFMSMYVNRDYENNNYRILVGIGIKRKAILFYKYLVSIIISIFIIVAHGVSTVFIPASINKIYLSLNQFSSLFMYLIIYLSIISIMFLLSIIARNLMKSILLNLTFIILSSLLGNFDSTFPFLPVKSLQIVISNPKSIQLIIISLIYILLTYNISKFIFINQEL